MLTPREVIRLNLIADAHPVFCPAATHWLVRSMSDALETELEMARHSVREREERLVRQAAIVVEIITSRRVHLDADCSTSCNQRSVWREAVCGTSSLVRSVSRPVTRRPVSLILVRDRQRLLRQMRHKLRLGVR
jgi:hypothetical protein